MSNNDFLVDLKGLKARIRDAIAKGVFSDNASGVFEQTLTQLVNEAEQNRLNLQNKAEQFERQAALFRGQAQAFNSFKSMAYGIVDGLVKTKEREDKEKIEEQKRLEEDVIDLEAAAKFEAKKNIHALKNESDNS